MKKLRLFLLAAFAISSATLFNSCTSSSDDDPNPGPTLTFVTDQGYTGGDATLPAGSAFKVGIVAIHDVKIDKLEIRVSLDGSGQLIPANCTICDSTINDTNLEVDYMGTLQSTPGTETWFFTVIDKDGLSTTKEIKITRTKQPEPIRFVDLSLGNQDNSSLGSSYSLSEFLVYLLGDAKTNSAKVDLIYVKDDTDGDILCAPSSNYASTILDGASGVGTWGTRNETKIRKTSLTPGEFDAMTDSQELIDALNNNSSADVEVTQVSNNDVYVVAPVSSNSRPVLIKIVSISSGDDSITLKLAAEDI